MGFLATLAALEVHDMGKEVDRFKARRAAEKPQRAAQAQADNRANAMGRLHGGKMTKNDAALILSSYAEGWEQAGRRDFALEYRKMAFRVADGAPFAVTIDPQTGEKVVTTV